MAERPMMRRKSSAQNLLSTFTSRPSNISPSALTSATMSPPLPPLPDLEAPPPPDDTSIEYLRDLVQKRIITLTYMRNMHEGHSHWFHTIYLSKSDIERELDSAESQRRCVRFTVLGMSLGNLLDIHHAPDLLRGLFNTLTEWEQVKEEGTTNSKLRQAPKKLFRNRGNTTLKGRPAELYVDASGESSSLAAPHIPFQLDYHHTLIALLDVLSEVYAKLSRMLGSPPTSRMMGPLGPLSPHPGVADLIKPDDSLFSIVNATATTPMSGPSQAFPDTDAILKIDTKLRKITGALTKELDIIARQSIKNELETLDPRLELS